ncbi:MAG: aldehyde dehydrogenase family protein [Planctomycetota bacterium]|nr:aldehyde dehydrogenase family protein [Planctomycetota bacterium]
MQAPKTHKLFIDGKFPRSESGRVMPSRTARGEPLALVSQASRKDLRDAVEAARRAQAGWAGASGYLRGQIMYRVAEMLDARRAELQGVLTELGANEEAGKRTAGSPKRANIGKLGRGAPSRTKRGTSAGSSAAGWSPRASVDEAIDLVIHLAGWCDKHVQVLGSVNPVAGPYWNVTTPEAMGVCVAAPWGRNPLVDVVVLGLTPLIAGNAAVVLVRPESALLATPLAEVLATSDVPSGVVNVLTGMHAELLPVAAAHRDVDLVVAGAIPAELEMMVRSGVAENVKRVHVEDPLVSRASPVSRATAVIRASVEMKTVWHPALA